MTGGGGRHSRRFFLGGVIAGAATGLAYADAPLRSIRPPPRGGVPVSAPSIDRIVGEAQLGGRTCVTVADARTGQVLEEVGGSEPMPPASVAKAVTALYGLDRLGLDFRFRTSLHMEGSLRDGEVEGDLTLVGGGDPTLTTDDLAVMAAELKAAGVRQVRGRFRLHDAALPYIRSIDPTQPEHVGYNPSVSGLNLNFNRVHFEWRRGSGGYQVAMDARSDRFRPTVGVARMRVEERQAPLYTYSDREGLDDWTVARPALGDSGSRWLPVRRPADYAGEVFRELARAQGVIVGRPERRNDAPGGIRIVERQSEPLGTVVRDMLKYSTNLTAEVVGLSASAAQGPAPATLAGSAGAMSAWLSGRLSDGAARFVDHSGLGVDSRISPRAMVQALTGAGAEGTLRGLLKAFEIRDAKGRTRGTVPGVVAKTGTLNFVSSLAGYVEAPSGRVLAFAIFSADLDRRARIAPEDRERPEGARGWSRRSRAMQQALLERWAAVYG